jgi:hypothetical protein
LRHAVPNFLIIIVLLIAFIIIIIIYTPAAHCFYNYIYYIYCINLYNNHCHHHLHHHIHNTLT